MGQLQPDQASRGLDMDAVDVHETDRLRPEASDGPARILHSFSSEVLTFSHMRSNVRSSTPLEELRR
jgi:hypothetical protein